MRRYAVYCPLPASGPYNPWPMLALEFLCYGFRCPCLSSSGRCFYCPAPFAFLLTSSLTTSVTPFSIGIPFLAFSRVLIVLLLTRSPSFRPRRSCGVVAKPTIYWRYFHVMRNDAVGKAGAGSDLVPVSSCARCGALPADEGGATRCRSHSHSIS